MTAAAAAANDSNKKTEVAARANSATFVILDRFTRTMAARTNFLLSLIPRRTLSDGSREPPLGALSAGHRKRRT
jgi:hypothetical protein